MVGYQIYPKYIDSGVAWMGDVPEHWVPIRFKHRLLEKKKVSNPGLNAGSISFGRVIFKVAENLAPETKASYQEVLAGEFLINPLNMNYDLLSLRTALSAIDVVVSTGYIVIRSEDNLVKRYVRWLLQAFDVAHMKTLGSGVRQTINYMDIGNSFFYEPPKDEQQKIANFLDHETAKIDTLIDKQHQLITLLKEKRQAVISHAVTKGLNPNAPMRDSGVEWLGEVPMHWTVAQLKFNTLEMQTGPFGSQLHAEDYVVDGIPLINPAHMTSGKILPDSKVTVDKETQNRLKRHKLSAGEIIFARRGELGRCAIVTSEQEGWLCGTGSLKAKLNERLIPEYAYLLITSDGVISELSLESKGSTMDNLNTETLGRVRMPVPPINVQDDILKYVENVAGKYKSLISSAEKAIGFMQERRTAIISAAVTGKIDLRNWLVPETSTTNGATNDC
jgi:type I restriction enzyme S subunit